MITTRPALPRRVRSGGRAQLVPRMSILFGIALGSLFLSSCGSAGTAVAPESTTAVQEATLQQAPTLDLVAAFYPLQFVLERVGGDLVEITSLAPPGGHSHDLELGPQQVVQIEEADLVVLISGFMPALDQAVRGRNVEAVIDAAVSVDMIEGHAHSHDHDHGHSDNDGPVLDPHIWLDPTNVAVIAQQVAERLGALDPTNADRYRENAAALEQDLLRLDNEWMSGTMNCEVRDLIVAHEAFGYLANRYRFTQRGISGISPDAEPSPKKIAEIMKYVRDRGVRTIYYESLIDPRVAETIARETGAETAKLDPIESRSAGSTEDYLSIMRTNLATLRDGNGCV